MAAPGTDNEPSRLRVVRGAPTDEELAAVVVALAVTSTAPAVVAPAPISRWARSARPRR
ncbi:acyl-CoA carboxylase epsilon subunit [Luedemannella helvata]